MTRGPSATRVGGGIGIVVADGWAAQELGRGGGERELSDDRAASPALCGHAFQGGCGDQITGGVVE